MHYSIGDVARSTGISVSTLRYYDREGMFPDMARRGGGIRVFSEKELGILRVIECLKKAGMSIREIKEFLNWCQEGDASLEKRQNMFHARLREVERQMEDLQKTLNTLKYKCWYYDTAVAAGSEAAARKISPDQMPEDIRKYRI
jgi:DNA-binding transcriptional MerR regulator